MIKTNPVALGWQRMMKKGGVDILVQTPGPLGPLRQLTKGPLRTTSSPHSGPPPANERAPQAHRTPGPTSAALAILVAITIDSGSIDLRGRFVVDPGSIPDRSGIVWEVCGADSGSSPDRFGIDSRSVMGRFGIDPRSIQGGCGVDYGSICG